MSLSLCKSTLNFLTSQSILPARGHHEHRLETLSEMVVSGISHRGSSLNDLSYFSGTDIQSESSIKKCKRWISSIYSSWATFYAPYISQILTEVSKKGEIIILIDGSVMCSHCVCLMLSVVWNDISIPLVWLVRTGEKGHFAESVHLELLDKAKTILPTTCRIVLLADGEFDGKGLRQFCNTSKWEFVIRTSKDRKVSHDGELTRIDRFYPDQSEDHVYISDAIEGDHAICWHGKSYNEPIFLLTNMELGRIACKYYKKRFKIESMFKQFKSQGFFIDKSMLRIPERVSNLVLIIALAYIIVTILGMFLKKQDSKELKVFLRAKRVQNMIPALVAFQCLKRCLNYFEQKVKLCLSDFQIYLAELST